MLGENCSWLRSFALWPGEIVPQSKQLDPRVACDSDARQLKTVKCPR